MNHGKNFSGEFQQVRWYNRIVMGIFRKKQGIVIEGEGEKTPVKFSRKERRLRKTRSPRRRKLKKRIALGVTVLILAVLGVFGFKAYAAIRNIFAEGSGGLLNLLGGSSNQPLRGESSGRTNILILGVGDKGHDGEDLTDTMIIASYDYASKGAAMISIPRDTYVQIPKNGYSKINAANAYGEQNKYPGGGVALTKETVEKTFGQTIHYYIKIDFSGLEKTVDALGGITVDVENSFCDYDYPKDRPGSKSTVCFEKGSQQMNGAKALQYSRSRHAMGEEGSDFARSKRQQRVMIAIKEKALSANTAFNPKKVLDVLSVLGEHVKTDFQIQELARAYELSKGIDRSKIISKTLDSASGGYLVASSGAAGYILQPRTGNFKEIQGMIKNIFNEMKMRDEKAGVILLNGTWNTGLAERVAAKMKEDGYNIVSTGDADAKNYTKTTIIDYTDGKKPNTIKALEEKFGVKAKKETPAAGTTTFEIKVVLGRDYKE